MKKKTGDKVNALTKRNILYADNAFFLRPEVFPSNTSTNQAGNRHYLLNQSSLSII